MKRVVVLAGALTLGGLAVPGVGNAQSGQPIQAMPVDQVGTVLPRNTPVYLSLNETLNTKSARTKAGNTFTLSVMRDVVLQRHVVIPRGSRAIGTVVYRTRKGGFGKSGKIEISLDHIEVGDQRIAIQRRHREEGEGNSSATVATFMLLSMVGSGLITGHSAEIPAGREFTAWTTEDVPVQLIGDVAAPPVTIAGAVTARPMAGALPRVAPDVRPASFGNRHIRCLTCR